MEMFLLIEAIWLWGYEDPSLKDNNLNFNNWNVYLLFLCRLSMSLILRCYLM